MKRQRKKDIIFFPRFLKAFGSRGNNNRRFPNIALSFPGSAVICSMQTSYPTSLCYPHPSSPVDPPSVIHQIRPSPFSTCRFYMMVPARDPVCVCVCVCPPTENLFSSSHRGPQADDVVVCAPDVWRVGAIHRHHLVRCNSDS